MTSSTTVRRSATDHKGATDRKGATDQQAPGQQETVPGQRAQAQRKAERDQAPASRTLPLGIKLPGGTKGNLLWWGSLATLAALEIVDWPVAAVVAAGTWIAEQHVKQQKQLARAEASS